MKIVVDKKIKKFDGDVEDLLQTSQIVTETEDLKITELIINESTSYTFDAYTLTCFYFESDNPVTVKIQQQGSYIVNLPNTTEFSFTGTRQYLNFTLQNTSATNKVKIKVVMVE